METLFASIDYRDPIWIAVAFGFGFVAAQIALPPLVGFLVAGFVLHALGAEGGAFLNEMADLGVTLLLFSVGLKLRIGQLLRPEVWGVATVHMVTIVLLSSAILMALGSFGLPLLSDLTVVSALILGFALSFSSTVFAVKLLEEKDEMYVWYGRISIGILVVQDIAAAIFLGASTAKVPSPWAAMVILALFLMRPLLSSLLNRSGHGELQILFGLVLALGGATLFELVDMKGDLGALAFGLLLANHPKANELFKALLSLKDLFLVGFFLSIGLAGIPDIQLFLVAVVLVMSIPVKTWLYFWLLSRARVRVRTAVRSSQLLSSFSEFGLIVTAIATHQGWLGEEWLVIVAVAVALSFIAASALNAKADEIYVALRSRLQSFERPERPVGDRDFACGKCTIMLCGMGRIGTGAYDHLVDRYGDAIVGIDVDPERVKRHCSEQRNVLQGNLTNPDFWSRIDPDHWRIQWILLAMPTQQANLNAAKLARAWGFQGRIGAVAKFSDEVDQLTAQGVDAVFNIYAAAGSGFAEHAESLFRQGRASTPDRDPSA